MVKKKKSKYSLSIGLKKSLKNAAIILLPFIAVQVINVLPNQISEMSVAALISYLAYLVKNWLQNK